MDCKAIVTSPPKMSHGHVKFAVAQVLFATTAFCVVIYFSWNYYSLTLDTIFAEKKRKLYFSEQKKKGKENLNRLDNRRNYFRYAKLRYID